MKNKKEIIVALIALVIISLFFIFLVSEEMSKDKKKKEEEEKIEEVFPAEASLVKEETAPPEKTIEELVREVELGLAGNGAARREYLGDKYDEVQSIINKKYPKSKAKTPTKRAAAPVSAEKAEYQNYARSLFGQYGWSDADFEALVNLWYRESNWNPCAKNPTSGAYGIPQAYPGNKLASEGSDWQTNYKTQIRWGLKYIKGRYGSPTEAWEHFLQKNFY